MFLRKRKARKVPEPQIKQKTNKHSKPFKILNLYAGAACAVLIAVFNLYVNNAKSTRFSGEHCLKEKQS